MFGMTQDIPGISFNAQYHSPLQLAFVILLNIPLVHRSRTWQVQLFEGAVEYQCDLDIIVLTIGACDGPWATVCLWVSGGKSKTAGGMVMISLESLPPQHILIVVQHLVPRNVHLCKYICSLSVLTIFHGHIKLGIRTPATNSMDTTWLQHIQAIETSALSMHNESRKPHGQHRCTYIRNKCEISMR